LPLSTSEEVPVEVPVEVVVVVGSPLPQVGVEAGVQELLQVALVNQ
jgi:hypothetical protein